MGYADKNRRNEADRKRYAEKKNQIEASKEAYEEQTDEYIDVFNKTREPDSKTSLEKSIPKYRFY